MKTKFYLLITLAIIVFAGYSFINNNEKLPKRKSNRKIINTNTTSTTNNTTLKNTKTIYTPTKTIKNSSINQIIYKSSNTHEGIVGLFNKDHFDNPAYNVFHINLDKDVSDNSEVYLEYELYGVKDFSSVCKSINDQLSTGGLFICKSEGWSKQSEQINPKILHDGLNIVRFTVPDNATYGYKVRNISLRVKPTLINDERKLVVNQPNNFTYFRKYGYLQGFVSGTGSEKAKLSINGKPINNLNGLFEGLTEKQDTGKGVWNATVIAEFEDEMQLKTNIKFNKQSDYDFAFASNNKIQHTEQQISPIEKINVKHQGLQLSGDTNSLNRIANLSVTTLRSIDMPVMGTGMVNVTGDGKGYRLLPHGSKFDKDLKIKIKYDTTLLPVGYRPEEIRTYYFDETVNTWKVLQLDSIDKANCMVISRTNHFTDFINSIIKTPEMPETQAYTPTSLKDIKVANPIQGQNLISPPSANNMGTANVSFPIEIPAGRQGMQPNLALQYNSGGGNGWMGMGWDISIPSISVETRWGVPRYSQTLETESYLLAGQPLIPQVNRKTFVNRNTSQTQTQFYPRVEGAFNKIVRHGTNPKEYWWIVTDRNGVSSYYGKYPYASDISAKGVLRDDDGNIAYWALTETQDLNGNTITYEYDTVHNRGTINGPKGVQIYIKKITYTHSWNTQNGHYSVEFDRDDASRDDKIISCKYGLREVTAHLLHSILVKYDTTKIRKYYFSYSPGAFGKSLLCGVLQATSASSFLYEESGFDICRYNPLDKELLIGVTTGNKLFKFNYFDFNNTPYFGDEVTITSNDDNISTGTVGDFLGLSTASATDLSTSKSLSPGGGGGIEVGIGNPADKSMSIGGNYNYGYSSSEGLIALVDVTGDGLPDKVFRKNNQLYFHKMLYNGSSYSFDSKVDTLYFASSFLKEHSSSDSWGLEGHLGLSGASINASGSNTSSDSYTPVYFSDVNADGLIDIINEGHVYFHQKQNGKHYFTENTSDTVYVGDNPCNYILYTGEINDGVNVRNIEDFPNPISLHHESVRMWIAPFNGTVNINAPIDLIKDESFYRSQSKQADGIGYTIQHNNTTELIRDAITADDYNTKGVFYSNLIVYKGDRIYFRLQPKDSRLFDNVKWDPKITYINTGIDTTLTDADNKTINAYKASDDFQLSAKSFQSMPMHGTLRIRGSITAPALSDTIHFRINRIQNNTTNLVKEINFNDNTTINYYIDTSFTVDSNDILTFVAIANTNVEWSAITNNLKLYYTQTDNFSIDTTNYLKSIKFKPNIFFSFYPHVIKKSNPYQLSSGNYTIYPSLSYVSGQSVTGDITFVIKSMHKILGKKTLSISNNTITNSNPEIYISLSQTDNIYCEFYSDNSNYYDKISDANVLINSTSIPAGLHVAMTDTLCKFGNLYRGWGQFCYRPDDFSIKIDEDKLNVSEFFKNADTQFNNNPGFNINGVSNFTSLQGLLNNNAFMDPLNNYFSMMFPDLDSNVWRGFGDITMVGANRMSNERKKLDTVSIKYDSPIPIINGHNAKAPRKQTHSVTTSYNGGEGLIYINGSASSSNTTTDMYMDYMDLNGDRYPDIVGASSVQYSTPQGGLGISLNYPIVGVNQNTTTSSGGTFGTTFPLTANVPANDPKRTKIRVSGNGNVSATASQSDNSTNYTLSDVNGDGLPDKVYNDGQVSLNVGYKFSNKETWPYLLDVRVDESTNSSVGLGGQLNIYENSYGIGIGGSISDNNNNIQLMDVNGDGLQDIVKWDYNTPGHRIMEVKFNTGHGYTTNFEQIENHSYTNTESGQTYNESGNLSATLGFAIPIFGIPLKFTINPNITISPSVSKEKIQLTDINNDGYPDYVVSNQEGDFKVRFSNLGKQNLLKCVINPTFSSFEIDYSLSENSERMPQRNWQIASVKVFDGHIGDGVDTFLNTFKYKDPYYERYERESFGYDTVITSTWNTGVTNRYIYRNVTDAYHNDKFLFKGLKKYELLSDSANRKFVETIYTWKAALISSGEIIPDNLLGCYEGFYPVVTKEDKYFYEGEQSSRIHTQKEYIYGRWGNVVQLIDHGDMADSEDDLTANISYDTVISRNLLSLAGSINVLHINQILRSRSALYDTITGNLTEIRLNNTNSDAIIDFTHDSYGNISTMTYPENMNSQRKQYLYNYDNITYTYPISVTDEHNFSSSTEYDFRFGKPIKTTDITGNIIKFAYDSYGRTKTVLGPNEIANNIPYTIKFDYWDDHNRYNVWIDPDSVIWARTCHYDPSNNRNEIITVLFTDGLGRELQTKKNSTLYDIDNDAYRDSMIVSGKVTLDAFGRATNSRYPITEELGYDSIFNYSINPITPTNITYDVMDRKTSITLPDLTTSHMSYGFDNDYFNALRFKTIVTDANGIETGIFADVRQLKTTIITDYANTSNDDSTITKTKFIYDPLGELITSIDPEGNETHHNYDMLGNRIQRIHPDAGTTNYTYDNAGNLISMQTQNLINQGHQINYIYDYKHLVEIDYPNNPENNVYYEYGGPNSGNESGRITRQQDASGVEQFYYGNLGELTKNIHTFVMPKGETYTFAMEWNYDTWNRLQSIIYPDSEIVNYRYNNGGSLQNFEGSKNGTAYNYINSIGYDKFENRINMKYGNNSETRYTYDPLTRRLSNLIAVSNSGTMQDLNYTYDNIGNITMVQNNASQTNNNLGGTYEYEYTYDNINRLISANRSYNSNNTPNAWYYLNMSYSTSGNITYKDQEVTAYINGSNIYKNLNNGNYEYNTSKPHTVSYINGLSGFEGTLNYDANGNMTDFNNGMAGITRYHCWDEENRLSAVKDENYLSSYIYDASGERVWKLSGQVEQMQINGEDYVDFVNLNNYTLYTSPYMVINDKCYSKHYYIEGQRICSKLGGGMENNLIKVDSLLAPITSNYDNIKNTIYTMIKRNIDCVNFNSDNINLPRKFETLKLDSNNIENDQYFYHSDHLGSSSFITDAGGIAIQHLQYMPYGDVLVDQRDVSNFYTPYKFSAKEQDEETQYSYFGARYYTPELLSIWLSVDPMLDKYPNISPYNYCHWNPVIMVDPNGMDDYFNEDGVYLGKDEAKSDYVRIMKQKTWDANHNTDKNGVQSIDHNIGSDDNNSTLHSNSGISTEASLKVYDHYNPTNLELKPYENEQTDPTTGKKVNGGMQFKYTGTSKEHEEYIAIKIEGNKEFKFSDHANEIINMFSHEEKHYNDFLSVGIVKFDELIKTHRNWLEQRAVSTQMDHSSWENTRKGYKDGIINYGIQNGSTIHLVLNLGHSESVPEKECQCTCVVV